MRYYVYVLSRTDGRPFYVGKGSGKRIDMHELEARNGYQSHKCNIIRKIWRDGLDIIKEKIFLTDSEKDAFEFETMLIQHIGRENLTNLTNGGDGASGAVIVRSQEYIDERARYWREYWSNEDNRRKQSERTRRVMSDPVKKARIVSAINNPDAKARRVVSFRNSVLNGDTRDRMSNAARLKYSRQEERDKMSAVHSTPEKIELFRNIAIESWNNPETREVRTKNIKAKRSTPESRALTSQRSKEMWAKRKAQQNQSNSE